MIASEEKLRKASDRVFQEENPPKDRTGPLEWRRNFNSIRLRLTNLRLVTSCTIQDMDFVSEKEKELDFAGLLKPNVADHLAIIGLVDEEEMRDRLYCTVEDKEDKTLFSVKRAPRPIKVTIKVGEPTEETAKRPAGLYWGNGFQLDFDPN